MTASITPEATPTTWPPELTEVFARSVSAEFATLTKTGRPITWPVTPYLGGGTLDVSCGLAYPSKAERARRDPRVALSFSSGVGSGIERPDTVLVQGLATVRDADLQANTDRYLEVAFAKLPHVYAGVPAVVLERAMAWYWPRIWVEMTPLRIAWWPGGELGEAPRTWSAPRDLRAPASDPPPVGPGLGAWTPPPPEVAARLDVADRLGRPIVTTTDADGWPLPVRTREVHRTGATQLAIRLPVGVELLPGQACVTFHAHPERFDRQENVVVVGEAVPRTDGWVTIEVERALGDFSLPGGRIRQVANIVSARSKLAPRVAAEATRRGQPVPQVRMPRRN